MSALDGPGGTQSGEEPHSRRGRPPKPIVPSTSVSHRAWLEPLRSRLFDSGMTLDQVAERAGYSKAPISELLRGNGQYPTWEITYSLLPVLDLPGWPVRWLWTAAAMEARKKKWWIEKCIDRVVLPGPAAPPLDHRGFVELRRAAYTAYGQAFLPRPGEAELVVAQTFQVLWMCWQEALSSPDVQRFAWNLFREAVMARAPHRGEYPDLTLAAFDTVALATAQEPLKTAQFQESMDVLAAYGALPELHLDVMVLKHMRGLSDDVVAGVMGVPPATVRSSHRHAVRTLTRVLGPHYLGGTPQ